MKAQIVEDEPKLEEMEQVLLLKEQNKSLRAIAAELGISLGKVQRRDKRAQKLGLTVDFFKARKEAGVSDVSGVTDTTPANTEPEIPGEAGHDGVQGELGLEDLPE